MYCAMWYTMHVVCCVAYYVCHGGCPLRVVRYVVHRVCYEGCPLCTLRVVGVCVVPRALPVGPSFCVCWAVCTVMDQVDRVHCLVNPLYCVCWRRVVLLLVDVCTVYSVTLPC